MLSICIASNIPSNCRPDVSKRDRIVEHKITKLNSFQYSMLYQNHKDNLVIALFVSNERKHLLLSDLSRVSPEEFRRQMCCE